MKTYKDINTIRASINFIGKQIEQLNIEEDGAEKRLLYLISKLHFERKELDIWYKEQLKYAKNQKK